MDLFMCNFLKLLFQELFSEIFVKSTLINQRKIYTTLDILVSKIHLKIYVSEFSYTVFIYV